MSKPRGVTLVELLVAVSLLSLLSLGMLMALRIALNAMNKADAAIIANRRNVAVQRILRREVDGLLPATAFCAAAEGQTPASIMLFQGEAQSMRFVSTYSLEEAARGYPRLLEFQVLKRDDGKGVRLIVNELLYTGPASGEAACEGVFPDPDTGLPMPRFRPIEPGPKSFVLADRLAHCNFSYLLTQPGRPGEWVPRWTSGDRLPRAVRVDMAPFEPDPGRVPLITVTAPLRITRRPGVSYANY